MQQISHIPQTAIFSSERNPNMSPENALFLDTATPERLYAVVKILTDSAMRARLRELGLITGTPVCCIRRGGGISSYMIRGAQISLRSETAHGILVTPL